MTKHHSSGWSVSYCLALVAICLSLVSSAQAGVWLTNSPLIIGRVVSTTTLLQNGKILVAGGFVSNSALNDVELYDPATRVWKTVAPLHTARGNHTATLLRNGKVLVAGGDTPFDFLDSAELYDPATETWALTDSLHLSRGGATATLLPDGRVLVAGGISVGVYTPTAEIYDPTTKSWTQTADMQDGRVYHTATLLSNGQVLVAGGLAVGGDPHGGPAANSGLSSMELYDPVQEKWNPAASMVQGRVFHTATLLPNGKVLFVGGVTNSNSPFPPISSAELYDPLTDTNAPAASMNVARQRHTATLCPDGTILITGGMIDIYADATNSTEIYDPSTDSWTLTTNALNTPRFGHTATLLPNGDALVVGGLTEASSIGTSTTELYDPTLGPATGTWTYTSSMQVPRSDFTMTLLPNGQVLVAGGDNNDGSVYASCELYNAVTETWTNTSPMNHARFNHVATLLPNGKVLVSGNTNLDSELYDPATGTWTTIAVTNGYYSGATATLLRDGKVLTAGSGGTISARLYDPTSNNWTVTGQMITPRYDHKAILLPDGKVFVVGGLQSTTNLSSAELYEPATGQWTAAGVTRASDSSFIAAALLASGNVLVIGKPSDSWSPVADLFDPLTGVWTMTAPPTTNHFLPTLIPFQNGKVLLVGEGGQPEIYDPASAQWSTTANLNLERQHERAVLLPDGRVLEAGGIADVNNVGTTIATAELYDLGLGFTNSSRPQIASVTSPLNIGDTLTINGSGFTGISEGSSGNTLSSSSDYPLVQLRNIESGQTTFLLTTNWTTGSFTSGPVWNFPAGLALATVFVNGIQSTSSIVNIAVPVPATTTLSNPQSMSDGSFQFTFTNNPGAVFGVLVSTNLTLPINNWTPLSGVTELSPGQFQFNDPQAGNDAQRFYQLVAP